MIIKRIEKDEDGTVTLFVCADVEGGEPDYSQLEVDRLVEEGKFPSLQADNQDINSAMAEAMSSASSMQIKVMQGASSPQGADAMQTETVTDKYSDGYFDSYASLEVHEVMLKDQPRMEAYSQAVQRCKHLIEGRAVLDVGAGTGLLAMLCAKAGARVVYAAEASSMAVDAAAIVRANGLEGVVKILRGPIEELDLPEKVDVLISEWMGFYLLHESMFPSVLFARDRWLKPGGLMLPSHSNIYVAPVSMEKLKQEKLNFWDDVLGLDMSHLKTQALQNLVSTPQVDILAGDQLLGEMRTFATINCNTVTDLELMYGIRAFLLCSIVIHLDGTFCERGRSRGATAVAARRAMAVA
eukprot:gene21164-25421_t